MKVGDDPAWSSPDLDDSDWELVHLSDVPEADSVVWLRAEIELRPEHLVEGRPLGIFYAAMATHEIWWDGERIGRGGVVGGSAAEEVPGPVQAHYVIPPQLASPGVHALALRTSAFHRHFHPQVGFWVVILGEYDRIANGGGPPQVALIALSGILMVAIFALLMFAQDRRDGSFLFLGLLCFTAAGLLVAEFWRSLFGYTYNWHLLRLVIVTSLSWLFDVLLLVFLARRFPMKGARWFVALGVLSATVPILTYTAWDPKAVVGYVWVFSLATGWCLLALWRRLDGGLLATVGLSICLGFLLYSPFRFPDRNLYIALDLLLICLLASHVRQVHRVRKDREQAELKSARLEIELLRKHIQPHFLMNTLTALSEWIEEEPQVAVRMIQSISEEFRVLSEISDRRLIRMEEEIQLCRVHLEIMSHRKGLEYRMTTEGVDLEAETPPAVIHTLVENAITHNHYAQGQVEFRLRQDVWEGRRRYVFESPLGPTGTEGPSGEGTGMRYIRARLQESFGSDWKLRSERWGDRWQTEIVLPAGG